MFLTPGIKAVWLGIKKKSTDNNVFYYRSDPNRIVDRTHLTISPEQPDQYCAFMWVVDYNGYSRLDRTFRKCSNNNFAYPLCEFAA